MRYKEIKQQRASTIVFTLKSAINLEVFNAHQVKNGLDNTGKNDSGIGMLHSVTLHQMTKHYVTSRRGAGLTLGAWQVSQCEHDVTLLSLITFLKDDLVPTRRHLVLQREGRTMMLFFSFF